MSSNSEAPLGDEFFWYSHPGPGKAKNRKKFRSGWISLFNLLIGEDPRRGDGIGMARGEEPPFFEKFDHHLCW